MTMTLHNLQEEVPLICNNKETQIQVSNKTLVFLHKEDRVKMHLIKVQAKTQNNNAKVQFFQVEVVVTNHHHNNLKTSFSLLDNLQACNGNLKINTKSKRMSLVLEAAVHPFRVNSNKMNSSPCSTNLVLPKCRWTMTQTQKRENWQLELSNKIKRG